MVAVAGTGAAFVYGRAVASDPVPPAAPAAPALVAEATPVLAGLAGFPLAARSAGVVPVGDQPSASSPAVDERAEGLAADGIPRTALQAYLNAAAREAARRPDCHLPWQLPAAIGRVESDHGRFNHAVLYADGRSDPPVIGIALDGNGTALIRDTDHGALDHDTRYDRAVGPMQFIPSTWASYGVDADGDGTADPFDLFDAAAAAADYLCVAGGDLATGRGQRRAVSAYNHSSAYVELVLRIERIYSNGTLDFGAPADPVPPPADLPPVAPGPPLSAGDPGGGSSSPPATTRPAGSSTPPGTGSSAPTATTPGTGAPMPTEPTSTEPTSTAPTDEPTTDGPTDDPTTDASTSDGAMSTDPPALAAPTS